MVRRSPSKRTARSKKVSRNVLQRIRLFATDLDGVLTDGKIVFFSGGSEAKMFDSKDGVGIKLAQRAGLKTGVISGRESEALLRRCEELGMDVEDRKSTRLNSSHRL